MSEKVYSPSIGRFVKLGDLPYADLYKYAEANAANTLDCYQFKSNILIELSKRRMS